MHQHCVASTVLDVFWIDATWSWCLTRFHTVHGFVCFRGCGWGGVNQRIWYASESKASGRGSEDRFNKVMKHSCHLAMDNSFPFADFGGADKVTQFCLSCRKLAKASLISPQRRWFSPAHATCSANWFLSCLRDLRRGPAKRLYSPLNGCPPLIDNTDSGLLRNNTAHVFDAAPPRHIAILICFSCRSSPNYVLASHGRI